MARPPATPVQSVESLLALSLSFKHNKVERQKQEGKLLCSVSSQTARQSEATGYMKGFQQDEELSSGLFSFS